MGESISVTEFGRAPAFLEAVKWFPLGRTGDAGRNRVKLIDHESFLIPIETEPQAEEAANQKLLQQATTEASDELQRIQRQPTRLKHRATPKIKLPTGETITEHQESRRVHHAGFPPITQALPKDIQQEDIIKHWPNHLW